MRQPLKSLQQQACELLARREHSRRELWNKLGRMCESEQQLQEMLDQLQAQGLQSDRRFAESFVRSRIQRGQGPRRIEQELRQRGVDDSEAAMALEAVEVDWFELAVEVHRKRFAEPAGGDARRFAKQLRFLLYRGFDHEQSRYAIDSLNQSPESR